MPGPFPAPSQSQGKGPGNEVVNIRRESGKIILKEEQERAVKELISGNDVYNGIDLPTRLRN